MIGEDPEIINACLRWQLPQLWGQTSLENNCRVSTTILELLPHNLPSRVECFVCRRFGMLFWVLGSFMFVGSSAPSLSCAPPAPKEAGMCCKLCCAGGGRGAPCVPDLGTGSCRRGKIAGPSIPTCVSNSISGPLRVSIRNVWFHKTSTSTRGFPFLRPALHLRRHRRLQGAWKCGGSGGGCLGSEPSGSDRFAPRRRSKHHGSNIGLVSLAPISVFLASPGCLG